MKSPRLSLRIDKLRLVGYSAHQKDALIDAMHMELQRLIERFGLPGHLHPVQGFTLPSVRICAPPGGDIHAAARSAARHLYEQLFLASPVSHLESP